MKICLGFAIIFGLTACGLSEKQCQSGDWEGIGLVDGRKGYLPDRLVKHTKSCGEFGISPDPVLWEQGRQRGLKSYCTVTNAYSIGRDGTKIRPSCAPIDQPVLFSANAKGLRYYEVEQQIIELESKMDEMALSIADAANDPLRISKYSGADLRITRARLLLLRSKLRGLDRI